MFLLVVAIAGVLAVTVAQQHSFGQNFNRLPLTRRPRPGQTAPNNIALDNCQEYTYVSEIAIGEPPQFFKVVLDTGSSDLWVASTECKDDDCTLVPRFSRDASTTLEETLDLFRLSYLSGSVTGETVRDTVTMGQYQVQSQVLALARTTAALGLASTQTSGILGLGFSSIASISAGTGATILENLLSSIPEPENRCFAFHLGRDFGPNDPTSSFTIGSLDPRYVSDPSLMTVSDVSRTDSEYDYWKMLLRRLTVNGSPFALSRSSVPGPHIAPIAVLDSGTTLVLGPTPDVAALYKQIGPAFVRRSQGTYQIRCTHAVLLGFVLGDHNSAREYLIDPADLAWEEEEGADGWCTGGVQANDGVNAGDWLLGDVFLRNVYTKHCTTPPQIGLLNLTNPESALAAFRVARGVDPDGGGDGEGDAGSGIGEDRWDTDTGYVKRGELGEEAATDRIFGAIAGAAGFILGGLGAVGWRVWRGV